MLADIVQTYYETNRAGLLTAYLSGENIASFIVKKNRLAQTGDKIKELVKSISGTKKDMENETRDLDSKKTEFVSKNEELENKNSTLEAKKRQNQSLLNETAGDEARYEKLLARVQKSEARTFGCRKFCLQRTKRRFLSKT